jgi:membrane protein DedA with SNARE-associated domain
MDQILHWVSQYGYLGILGLLMVGIVGLPVPDEWLLMFTGYLIFRGDLRAVPAIAAAFVGSCCGISVSYVIGRTLGISVIEKYGMWLHVDRKRMEKVHAWFERIGKWMLLVGYFIPGVRHLTAISAGISTLRLPVFAFFAFTGALLWSITFITVGFLVGEKWRQIAEWLDARSWMVLGGAGAGLVIGLLLWWWRSRRQAE